MDRFAKVFFGADEREQQRDFLLAMAGAEIIQISREEINDWYKEEVQRELPGCENHLVLHGEEEMKRFMYVMNTFFPKQTYDISDEPGSKEFREWLDKKKGTHEEHAS